MYELILENSHKNITLKKDMQKQLEAVKLFHTTYGLGVSEEMKADLGEQKNILRFELMKEENEEYLEAVKIMI